jgi:hypothetical protein
MIDWPSYNRSLVRRGEILFSYDFLDNWSREIERMNRNKKGKPFVFPDSFILAIGYIRYSFHPPYRQTEGNIKATGKRLPSNHSYGHICKRINKLNIDIKREKIVDDLIITIDSTDIKVTNRGQLWMSDKWHKQNKKGYLKIHVAVDIKTKEILALEVTSEKVHDNRMLKKLINHVLDNSSGSNSSSEKQLNMVRRISASADGAYDSNSNFRYLEKKGIKPGIKVRKNSIQSYQVETTG